MHFLGVQSQLSPWLSLVRDALLTFHGPQEPAFFQARGSSRSRRCSGC